MKMLESSNVHQMTIMLLASIATAVALYAAFPQETKSTPKLARKVISDKAPLISMPFTREFQTEGIDIVQSNLTYFHTNFVNKR